MVEGADTVAKGLAENPLAWFLALSLLAVAYLFRLVSTEREAAAKALADLQARYVDTIRADAKEQREILFQIVPLASKLTESLEILERLTDAITARD